MDMTFELWLALIGFYFLIQLVLGLIVYGIIMYHLCKFKDLHETIDCLHERCDRLMNRNQQLEGHLVQYQNDLIKKTILNKQKERKKIVDFNSDL